MFWGPDPFVLDESLLGIIVPTKMEPCYSHSIIGLLCSTEVETRRLISELKCFSRPANRKKGKPRKKKRGREGRGERERRERKKKSVSYSCESSQPLRQQKLLNLLNAKQSRTSIASKGLFIPFPQFETCS